MKKTWKKIGVAFLATAALTLGACGNNNGGNTGTKKADDTTAQNAEDANAADESSKAEADVPVDNGEIVKLKMWGFDYTSTSEDMEAVSEAVSAITREKIGVEVEITRNGDGDKLNLAMNSGEEWDLVNYHAYSGGLSTLVNNGMAAPIDDLAAEYGQDALAAVGDEMLNAGRVKGVLYSIPSIDTWANSYGMAISADILEELSIDPDTLKTWDDIHEALLKMKEAHPDKYPVVTAWGGGGMQKAFAWDNLGTGFWDGLGILEDCHSDSTTVVNMYETESYRAICDMMYQWKQEGLLMPDATTTTENMADLIGTVGYAVFENITPSKKQELTAGTYWKDKPGVGVEIISPFITSDAGGNSYFIPTVSKHPEEAMKLWNLMYTDKELANILVHGVEGRDFEYTDENKDMAHRIEGSTYGYMPWTWPNQSIAVSPEGVDKDIWEQNRTFRDSAAISPALGFKFDSSAVMNEITACNNVIAKYEVGLRWGELNPDETLPKLNEELYSAGLQTIIDEKQKQLDTFLGK